MEQVIQRFLARSDAGREVTIVEYGRYKTVSTLEANSVVPMLSRFELEDGSSVNKIDDLT